MKPITRLIVGVIISLIAVVAWTAIVSFLFDQPLSYVFAFLGGYVIGTAYVLMEFDTINRVIG